MLKNLTLIKTLIIALIFSTSLSARTFAEFHFEYPKDEQGHRIIPENIKQMCSVKGNVAEFVFLNRNKVTEQQMLAELDTSWTSLWSTYEGMELPSYLDMQRIVRDYYRIDSTGKFKEPCCNKDQSEDIFVSELIHCLKFQY